MVSAQQVRLTGEVRDAETNEVLPGVNVYLSQTLLGSTTNADGQFAIESVPLGSYTLVASLVGYTSAKKQVEIVPERSAYTFSFTLTPAVLELREVVVTAKRPRKWRRDLKRFEELFIGKGPNARQTTLLNPYVLDFATENNVFSARASEPLRIENDALGYSLTFELQTFKMDNRTKMLHMQGPFHFTERTPADADEAKRWAANRARTFKGSLQHVLASLIAGNSFTQGITVQLDNRTNAPFSKDEPFLKSIDGLGYVEPTTRSYLYRLDFPYHLYVAYQSRSSWITLNWGAATIHESGYVYAPAGAPGSLTVFGALSHRRVADLLPRDYAWSEKE